MADTKISALAAASAALMADELPVNEAGTSKKITLLQAQTLLTLNNYSLAAQSPSTSRTYITGSAIAIPVGKLRIGTMLCWVFDITKTAAGTASSIYDIAFGTTGTTSDTARVSFTKPAGTAVVDCGRITIEAICRGPLSASGVVVGHFNLTHNLQITGHAVIPCVDITTISSVFDVTTPTYVGICVTGGASDAITIQMVQAYAMNL